MLQHFVPDRFVGAFTKGDLLQVVTLAVLVGIGMLAIPEVRRGKINGGLKHGSKVLFSFISLVMKLAPIGAFGAVAYSVGSRGTAVLIALTQRVLSFYAVVAVFIAVVLGVVAKMSGFSLWCFLRFIKDEILIVLATHRPKARCLACWRGSTSLNGVMFIAHVYGVPITVRQQSGMLLLMLLTSKGAATASGGSYVVFAATVTSTGILPVEGLA